MRPSMNSSYHGLSSSQLTSSSEFPMTESSESLTVGVPLENITSDPVIAELARKINQQAAILSVIKHKDDDEALSPDEVEYRDLRAFYYTQTLPYTLYGRLIDLCKAVDGSNFFVFILVPAWPCILCFLLQGVLLAFLWVQLPNYADSGLCSTNPVFELALIASFLAYMYQPACDICWEFYCIMMAKRRYSTIAKVMFENKIPIHQTCLMLQILAMEFVIFIAILVVGVKYILTTDGHTPTGASNLIQSALSIVFISEVDEQLAKLMYSNAIRRDEYICPLIRSAEFTAFELNKIQERRSARKARALELPGNAYLYTSLILKPIAFTCTCVGIVFGIRNSYC